MCFMWYLDKCMYNTHVASGQFTTPMEGSELSTGLSTVLRVSGGRRVRVRTGDLRFTSCLLLLLLLLRVWPDCPIGRTALQNTPNTYPLQPPPKKEA